MKPEQYGATTRLLILMGRAFVEAPAGSINPTRTQLIDAAVKEVEAECGGAMEETIEPAPEPEPIP